MKKIFLIAVFSAFLSANIYAACSQDLVVNDTLYYDIKEITIDPSCKEFTINMKHTGKAVKAAIGHNWVLAQKADMQSIITEGMKQGLKNDYLNKKNPKVLAASKMIGGGEKTSVKFSLSKLKKGTDYMYFCTFPGHLTMRGTIIYK